jgi:hypothetical protein
VFLVPKGGRSSPLSPLSPAVGAPILNPFRFSKQFLEEVFSEVREERAKRYAIWPLRLVPMFATVVALINSQGRADESRPSTEGGEKKCRGRN